MKFAVGKAIIAGNQAPLPSLPRQAVNASGAILRVAKAVIKRQPIWLTPAKREEHQAICRSNQCGFFRESDQRCGHPRCGCFTRLKTLLTTEECPVGLFKREATTTPGLQDSRTLPATSVQSSRTDPSATSPAKP
ncbi:MAG: hypothetical protein ABS95_01070 [Verrucomicrobia bacterium SCN 57-15]|nr:MAG: hypothetical protein ABS95_01070 [Verrucomicrobia bacterium SCN 57-15]